MGKKKVKITVPCPFYLMIFHVFDDQYMRQTHGWLPGRNDMEGSVTVKFPQHIGFLDVPEYMEVFKGMNHNGTVIFDLSETVNLHSSFIGFLIHAKHTISREKGKLTLLLSFTVEKLLIMLNIIDFFTPEIEVIITRKSA